MNANLIFKWLRDPKYRPAPLTGSEASCMRFLPVEIVAETKAPLAGPVADSCIEIELAAGVTEMRKDFWALAAQAAGRLLR